MLYLIQSIRQGVIKSDNYRRVTSKEQQNVPAEASGRNQGRG